MRRTKSVQNGEETRERLPERVREWEGKIEATGGGDELLCRGRIRRGCDRAREGNLIE